MSRRLTWGLFRREWFSWSKDPLMTSTDQKAEATRNIAIV